MYCSMCGAQISENLNFCIYCGTAVKGQTIRMIRLVCPDCMGVMDVDLDRNVRNCPYCGSKQLLIKGDKARFIKLKSQEKMGLDKMNRYSTEERAKIKQEIIIERNRRFGTHAEKELFKTRHRADLGFIKELLSCLVFVFVFLAVVYIIRFVF